MLCGEVISVGDELTSGERLDTNTQWISQRLAELGIEVWYHSTAGDRLDTLIDVFRRAVQRADIVLVTGGLGPTADDLTRQAMAEATARPLELRSDALEHIERLFARRQRPMPEANRIQALFPLGSQIIPNPHGTAPGIDLLLPRTNRQPARLFALPGVPAEMREMWHGYVVPELTKLIGHDRQVIRHHCIKCFGVGESDLEAMLPNLIQRGRDPQVGITVHKATITLRITARGRDDLDCHDRMQPTIDVIHQSLGELVFGTGDDELHHAVGRLLAKRSATLATAEWGTHGALASLLGQLPEARQSYRGGLVLRDQAAARDLLRLTDEHSHIDPLIAETAQRLRDAFQSDYALVIGPAPSDIAHSGLPESRHGEATMVVGLATPTEVTVVPRSYGGHPDIVIDRAAKTALNLLRLELCQP